MEMCRTCMSKTRSSTRSTSSWWSRPRGYARRLRYTLESCLLMTRARTLAKEETLRVCQWTRQANKPESNDMSAYMIRESDKQEKKEAFVADFDEDDCPPLE